ncbi:hypothetical protein TTHERM_000901702 (macronuclear) [Tetrahymena thermophila SB210]|uniref:Uncharacterized protein n=1 Tax=Tetrahymena thermophila (strain SB210) TaxID=312017 RepID=W7X436_TETTS|nr:hypothetical protein TTHERM_000901702 [Tetrahymena thermophila SB210]EWS71178.1 hypothetical protein TTHERM_000901702 [Tetrahymena thermophila SB210]|eukprot:XP_012656276.1 hypothetical protein TTHERM_000901702 [Tetrahymena thermophila SB210]
MMIYLLVKINVKKMKLLTAKAKNALNVRSMDAFNVPLNKFVCCVMRIQCLIKIIISVILKKGFANLIYNFLTHLSKVENARIPVYHLIFRIIVTKFVNKLSNVHKFSNCLVLLCKHLQMILEQLKIINTQLQVADLAASLLWIKTGIQQLNKLYKRQTRLDSFEDKMRPKYSIFYQEFMVDTFRDKGLML